METNGQAQNSQPLSQPVSIPSQTPMVTPVSVNTPPQNTNDKSDKMYGSRSIYDASSLEIIWKNFIAGLMRGLGSVLIWLIFSSIMFSIFMATFWPKFKPFVDQYMTALSTLSTVQSSTPSNINSIDINQVTDILNSLKTPTID